MSALTSPVLRPRTRGAHDSFTRAAQRHRAHLQVVPELTAQVSQRVFWGLLVSLVIVGTTLVLMLNVTLQSQAFEMRTLAAEEQRLLNHEAVLQQQLAERSSSDALAQQAVDLGMVPATAPGFLLLPDGTMVGAPKAAEADGPYVDLRTPVQPVVPVPAPGQAPAAPAVEGAGTVVVPAPGAPVAPVTPVDPVAAVDPVTAVDPVAVNAGPVAVPTAVSPPGDFVQTPSESTAQEG